MSHRPFYTSLVASGHESDDTDSGEEEAPAAVSGNGKNVRSTSMPAEKRQKAARHINAKKRKC